MPNCARPGKNRRCKSNWPGPSISGRQRKRLSSQKRQWKMWMLTMSQNRKTNSRRRRRRRPHRQTSSSSRRRSSRRRRSSSSRRRRKNSTSSGRTSMCPRQHRTRQPNSFPATRAASWTLRCSTTTTVIVPIRRMSPAPLPAKTASSSVR